MKILVKYISFFVVFTLALTTICFATDINMNLEDTSTSVNNTLESSNSEVNEQNSNQLDTTLLQTPATSYTTVSGTNSVQDDGLNLTNIINIFVVVVGIVLILLGLAILIRLKY